MGQISDRAAALRKAEQDLQDSVRKEKEETERKVALRAAVDFEKAFPELLPMLKADGIKYEGAFSAMPNDKYPSGGYIHFSAGAEVAMMEFSHANSYRMSKGHTMGKWSTDEVVKWLDESLFR